MFGLYLHIPFCNCRCYYCDFFSTTEWERIEPYIEALCDEIKERKDYLPTPVLSTIYFGGGTPSLLSPDWIDRIFATINDCFEIEREAEITLEANPDDLTPDYVDRLAQLPFNRISVGIQSFKEKDLQTLNRRHTSAQAVEAVKVCREHGFSNINIDLMYGLPQQSLDDWARNLDHTLELKPEHISAYLLTYEEGTVLYKRLQKREIEGIEEELSLQMYEMLVSRLTKAEYIRYEISNFAKEGRLSRHNSSYWKGTPYLGVGASAHSYNGFSRQWNVSSLADYMRESRVGEIEPLDTRTQYNDYILTRLRTMWGIDTEEIREKFGEVYTNFCLENASLSIKNELLLVNGNIIKLSHKGLFVSDGVIMRLLKMS